MVKNRDYSPENRPSRRPVICAKRRATGVRNAVDHVAVALGNEDAYFVTSTHKALMAKEEADCTAHRPAKRCMGGDATNTIDHVQRLKAGEKGREAYMAACGSGGAALQQQQQQQQGRDENGRPMTPPPHSGAPAPLHKQTTGSFNALETVPFVESRPSTPINHANQHHVGFVGGASSAPRSHTARVASFVDPNGLLTSPAPQQQQYGGGDGLHRSAVKPRLYASATGAQSNVKAARQKEAAANDKGALEYYGDIGVGLGITSRKRAVAPPKESFLHPVTGLLLPSARAASASRVFDKSGMNANLRQAIAHGEFEVPLERRRSSIRVGRDASSVPRSGRDTPNSAAVLSRVNSFGMGTTAAPTASANRFLSPNIGGRYAQRAAHPSENTNTNYLFGSGAIAERQRVLTLPRKAPHALDDTTFDKPPTAEQHARDRRHAYAIEMVTPRYVPTNVSTLEMRDVVPTHAELLRKLEERPATRRGELANQYNDTTGFFDPAAPLPARGESPYRGARRSGSVGGAPSLQTARRAEERAQSVDSRTYNYRRMSTLELRASDYHGNVPPVGMGRRASSPCIDTARVLVPERQPEVGYYRPHAAPSPVRARPCQAAIVMDELATPTRARSVDAARPCGIRANFAAFVAPAMPYRQPVVTPSHHTHLWGTIGGGSGAGPGPMSSAAPPRAESPRGKRRVDSPCRSSSIVLC